MPVLCDVPVNRVATMARSGIFLARHQGVAITLKQTVFPPRWLAEIRTGNIAHFKQVGNVDVLGRHLAPNRKVIDMFAWQVHVGVARVPPAGR